MGIHTQMQFGCERECPTGWVDGRGCGTEDAKDGEKRLWLAFASGWVAAELVIGWVDGRGCGIELKDENGEGTRTVKGREQ
ncbi:hypothetical protein MANES_09G172701v8 [Manihot esculenta]|uniref:Uncharacterized protein n=1 Tax=Manihot esculenta TaxID=3983 RepID=A0ACB7H896_MANES|nr:hypothetical protein MANES_09G172701v8 [Manihot esculenta]